MLGNLGENLTSTMKKLVGMSVIDKKTVKEVVKAMHVCPEPADGGFGGGETGGFVIALSAVNGGPAADAPDGGTFGGAVIEKEFVQIHGFPLDAAFGAVDGKAHFILGAGGDLGSTDDTGGAVGQGNDAVHVVFSFDLQHHRRI
mgnify:CR=1 FL=1